MYNLSLLCALTGYGRQLRGCHMPRVGSIAEGARGLPPPLSGCASGRCSWPDLLWCSACLSCPPRGKRMLSPRRVKSSPTVVLYELRLIRPNTRSERLARMFEGVVKKWRGISRWYLQTHTSPRGEAVLQVVGERQSQVARVDNLYALWCRSVGSALQVSKCSGATRRARRRRRTSSRATRRATTRSSKLK